MQATGVQIKRAYDAPAKTDGVRLLVDRIWPRGVSKDNLPLDAWRKDLAPSTALRTWFGHDPAKWDEFVDRYRAELESADAWDSLRELARQARKERVTLVFGARDVERNQAVALKRFIDELD